MTSSPFTVSSPITSNYYQNNEMINNMTRRSTSTYSTRLNQVHQYDAGGKKNSDVMETDRLRNGELLMDTSRKR